MTASVNPDRRGDIALLLLGLAGTGLSLSVGLGTLGLAAIGIVERDHQAASLAAWAAGGLLTMAACGIPAVYLGVRGVLGYPSPRPARPSAAWFAILLLLPPMLALGAWALSNPGLLAWAAPLHVGTAIIPVAFAVLLVRVRGIALTSRRAWAQFLTGLWAMPPLAMALEILALIPILILAGIGLAQSPQMQSLLLPMLRESSQLSPSGEQALMRLMFNPWVIAGILGFIAGVVPLLEEAVKSLSLVTLGRRMTPAAAFTAGALGGAGYALFEALFLTQPDPSWLTTVVGRVGATMMHAFTAALTCWGVSQVVVGRRWWRLVLAYLSAVLMHGLWNASAVGIGFASLASESSRQTFSPGLVLAVTRVGPPLLVALGTVALVGLPLGAVWLSRREAPPGESPGGDRPHPGGASQSLG